MPDNVEIFFDGLRRRGHDSMLADITGRLRFDLENDGEVQSWIITFQNGEIAIAQQEGNADCVINMPRDFFEAAISGAKDMRSGWLRHVYLVHGSLYLLRAFERLLPQKPGMSDRRYARLAPSRAKNE
ncbi:SCP2 sterol-binding domain-containing protein [Micromonospora sp. NBC_00362]|uniref:SCP2 sterol-binding domain-containing protein n=1 Tax=Micromonospora sp. NBC_00362 TaxID=2975975 RepID=UPI00224CF208|nr:SCP2 sterol-binding domain-containing protein [Micromonospora sp. NBC_00362]MCX5121794.1 SCP2 sterol-binding domain-containing protein [Micromonospora sp. NBC_00362]